MFAIVYKTDGVPICVQVAGISPDPVVVWNSEGAARRSSTARAAPPNSRRSP